jgi:hypothetical protein
MISPPVVPTLATSPKKNQPLGGFLRKRGKTPGEGRLCWLAAAVNEIGEWRHVW